jgi:hypothetical protein
MLACWLVRSGFALTLFERAPTLRTGGYKLVWGETAIPHILVE